jgi:hypothetical protein
MKTIAIVMLSVALLAVETPVFAAEVQQASRSAGKLKQDQGIDLAAELEQRELVVKDRPEAPENYAESPTAQRLEGVANRHDQLFEIYDADVQLTADFDGDGTATTMRSTSCSMSTSVTTPPRYTPSCT